jgi:branched-chain amino acid transport system permease protein
MRTQHVIAPLVLLVAMIAAPFVLSVSTATELLIFGLAAAASYLVIGVGGLFSFGQAALFGIGGYVGGWIMAHSGLPMIVPLVAGALGAAAFAAIMAALCVRRSSIYFIMLTFAFNQLVYYAIYSWRSVTGGQDGLSDIARPHTLIPGIAFDLDRPMNFYALVAVVVFLSVLALLRVVDSPLGRVLSAARQNPRRVASIGYDVHRAQTLAFTLSGLFLGIAGVLYGMLYWIMPIDAVAWVNSGNLVFTVLIGGLGSLYGSLIGAAIFILLQDSLSLVWDRWPLLFGLVVIGVVLFLRGGVWELGARVRQLATRRPGRAAVPQ